MDFLEIIKLSLTALKANKVRSALTMLGIIIGVMAVILLISLGSGLQTYITDVFESLGTNTVYVMPGKMLSEEGSFSQAGAPNFAGSKLTLKHAKELGKSSEAISDAGAMIEMGATIKYANNSKYAKAQGITNNIFTIYNITVESGHPLSKTDVDRKRKVTVIGPTLKEKLFNNNDPIGKKILIGEARYEVIGVSEKKGGSFGAENDLDNAAYIPITCSMDQFGTNNVMAIIISARDKDSIEEAKMFTKRYLLKESLEEDDFTIMDQASLLSSINQILNVLTLALGGIAAISLLVGGIGIMNIMLVSVTERTREIGLRKAVGAKFSDILLQFLTEAVVLCLLGGVMGILLGFGGSLIAQKFIPATVPLWSVILAFSFSAAVGIIFGVAPAYKGAKLDPIEALRYE